MIRSKEGGGYFLILFHKIEVIALQQTFFLSFSQTLDQIGAFSRHVFYLIFFKYIRGRFLFFIRGKVPTILIKVKIHFDYPFQISCSIKIEYPEREHKEIISKLSHRISSSSLLMTSTAIFKEIILWY